MHVVSVTTPTGAIPTSDLDGDLTPDVSNSVTLAPGGTNLDQDFGFTGTGSIGDTVYYDADANGVQDAGEPGLPLVTVALDIDFNGDTIVDHTLITTTDANGGYSFNQLPAGDYTVRVTQPAGSAPTVDADGLGTPNQSSLTLAGGENNVDQDFGYTGTGSLGDTVFFDVNGDGVLDAGDRGLPGVEVSIEIDVNGDTVVDYTRTAITDVDGNYLFDRLIPGDYRVAVNTATLPGGMAGNPTFDADGGNDHQSLVTLGAGAVNLDQDFGYTAIGSIGDRVWLDVNADGLQDPNEVGLANVDVQLIWYGVDGVLGTLDDEIFNTTTDADGLYAFERLPAGLYDVDVDQSTAPLVTLLTTGNDPQTVNLSIDENYVDADFGFVGQGSIGDFVWFDADGDGSYNPAVDHPYPGVVVVLTGDVDGDGLDESFTTTTDVNGAYNFSGLPQTSYTVAITPPAGAVASYDNDGGLDNQSIVVLSPGNPSDADQDFALTGTGSIGDTIFLDLDGDGSQQPGEPGIPGVTVQIDVDLDGDTIGDATLSTTTDQNGNYRFDRLPAGAHVVSVTTPTGAIPTSDLDGDLTPDVSNSVTLAPGGTNLDQDFGFTGTGSIGDTVYYDADANGVQDAGEPGLPLVTVALDIDFNGDTIVDHTLITTTDANGGYSFNQLPAGDYTVRVTQPAGSAPTVDADGLGTPNQSSLTLAGGENNVDQDFGYTGTGSLGDTVFFDVNGDGVLDAGDRGLPGVEVSIEIDVNGDTVVDYTRTAITDVDGNYLFDRLIPGDYRVAVNTATLPGGMAGNPTFDADGGNDHQSLVTLGAGAVNLDQDFGYTAIGSIGDRVWLDVNADGLQDPNEVGLANVDVQLTWYGVDGVLGTLDDEIFNTTTDADGLYAFERLPAGLYDVDVDQSTAPLVTLLTTGNDPQTVNLSVDESYVNADFGFVGQGSIGDFVWFDADGDGAYNPAVDHPYPGVVVVLTGDVDGDGLDESFTTTTDVNGAYNFSGLPQTSYTVAITPPAGAVASYDNDGGLDNQSIVVLSPGNPSDADQDFALTGTGSIGDTIFLDLDGDGSQQPGEPGIPGVTVQIDVDLDGDTIGDATLSTTTDQNGNYRFDRLPAGAHVVSVTTPTGAIPTSDLDGDLTPDVSNSVTLAPGGTNLDQDFGFTGTGSIGDTVYYDADANGVQDAGEPGLPLVTVALDIDFNGDTIVDHTLITTTDANGGYSFNQLPAGDYTVRVTQPAGAAPTVDADGLGTPNQSSLTLAGGENNVDQDFGYTGTGSLGDTVFFDVNGDGVLDAGDRGEVGVLMTLTLDYDGDGLADYVATDSTNASGVYSFGNLLPGAYTVTVDPSTLTGGLIGLGSGPTYDLDGTATAHTAALNLTAGQNRLDADFGYTARPDYVITKDDGLGAVRPGDRITYNIVVENAGNLDGTGVVVTDTFPTNVLTNVTASGGVVDATLGQIVWNLGDLRRGEQVLLSVTADIVDPLGAGVEQFTNSVNVTDDGRNGVNPTPGNNIATDTDLLDATPDYVISKSDGLSQVAPGDRITYLISVSNVGRQNGSGVVVTDDFPPHILTNVTASPGAVIDATAGTIIWNVGDLAAGDTVFLSVTADVIDPMAAGVTQLLNSVQVTDDLTGGPDPTPLNNIATDLDVTLGYVDLVISKDDNGAENVGLGETIVYTLTYSNAGDQDAANVVITETPPAGTSFVSSQSSTGWTSLPDGSFQFLVGDLASGATSSVQFAIVLDGSLPPEQETVVNTTSIGVVGVSGPDPTPDNNTASEETTIITYFYDSFNSFRDFDPSPEFWRDFERVGRELPPLPIDTMYSGIADPGTTLNGKIYDAHGRLLAEQTVVADSGGNWLMQFPTTVIWEKPHTMRLEQTSAVYDSGVNSGFNLRRYFHPAVHVQLFLNEPLTVAGALRNAPSNVLQSMHEAHQNPLTFGWHAHSYQLRASSTNASQN